MMRFLQILFAVCALLGSAPLQAEEAKEEAMNVTSIHRAITQQQNWLNTARPLTAEDLKGRIILLDFWTYCCINCMHVIPDLHYLEKKFGDKLTVIGVHSAKFTNERDNENIRNAMLRYEIEHPVVNDSDFAVWQSFNVRAWPTFVLISPMGSIEEVYSGEGNRDAVEADIRKLLARYEGRITTAPLPLALEKNKAPKRELDFPGKLALVEIPGRALIAISDSGHHRVLLTDQEGKILRSFGNGQPGLKDGPESVAQFKNPQGLLSGQENGRPVLYVADTGNHALRRIELTSGTVSTLAGTGEQSSDRSVQGQPGRTTKLASPWDLAFYPDRQHIAIAMAGTHQLWSYDLSSQKVSVLAGNGRESIDDGVYPYNSLSQPSGVSTHKSKLYFVDSETSALRVLEQGRVTTLIGTGLFDYGYKEGVRGEALMQHPLGLFSDESGVYIADAYNHAIRRYNPATGTLHNYAGTSERGSRDGALESALFNEPNDILKIGDKFYVADTNNHAIRIIDTVKNTVSTLDVGLPKEAAPAAPLPNLVTLPEVEVSMSAAILNLQLAPGWKINKDAPSTIELLSDGVTLKKYTLSEIISQRMVLPSLEPDKKYQLQAVLYYCEEAEGSQCLIKSLMVNLTPSAEGINEVNLPVN